MPKKAGMEEKAPSGIPGDEEVSLLYFLRG